MDLLWDVGTQAAQPLTTILMLKRGWVKIGIGRCNKGTKKVTDMWGIFMVCQKSSYSLSHAFFPLLGYISLIQHLVG